MGGTASPPTPHCFKTIHASNRKHHATFAGKTSCADHVVCKRGRLAPTPPLFSKTSTLPIRNVMSSPFLQEKESCAEHFVCKWRGCVPPNPPAVLKLSMLPKKKHNVINMFAVCRKEELCGSFCLQMRGLRPPNPPVVLKPSMLAKQMKHHVITMFAVRDGCADHFVITAFEAFQDQQKL